MATMHFSAEQAQVRSRRSRRAFALVVASLLLHLFVFRWVDNRIGLPSFGNEEQPVIATRLLAPDPVEPVSVPAPAPPKPKRRPLPPAMHETEPPVPVLPEADGTVAPVAEIASPEELPPAAIDIQLPAEQQARYKVAPPPSAELEYDVVAGIKGMTYHGGGMINWHAAGDTYRITGKTKVAFFTVLDFTSEGVIDEFGISPVLYTEKPRNRSATNTHFNRERSLISFSASSASYPRTGGEQDRASVIWQLAGIGRGDAGKFMPDTEITLFVAGTRNAETWQIRIIGQEEIDTGAGKVMTWHMTRVPRPGSYERRLDIWLAPQQEWFPVKLRYVEANGDYLDMMLSKIMPANPR